MIVIDIDDFIKHLRAANEAKSYVKEYHINEARALHKRHTNAELIQLVLESSNFSKSEMRTLYGIGLRNPARQEIAKLMIQKELKERQLLEN
jgi:hypothetical protein